MTPFKRFILRGIYISFCTALIVYSATGLWISGYTACYNNIRGTKRHEKLTKQGNVFVYRFRLSKLETETPSKPEGA